MPTLASLLVSETKAQIYARGLEVADALGLNTSSWVAGDPTRSLYHFLGDALSRLEEMVAGFIGSGFLDYAADDWLTLLAEQAYNVERVEGTFATSTVTLTNSGGGVFIVAAGDVVVKNTGTGKTYTNTTGGTLSPGVGEELELDVTADEVGSDSSAAADAINALVTTMLGVTVTASTAALGLDEEEDEALRDRCRAKLGMLSSAGPADAYNYVVKSSDLTGVTDITRARTVGDSTIGDVVVYVAGAAGDVDAASVTAAQLAVETWAAPICITPTVTNATEVLVPVTYSVWLYASVGEETPTITTAIAAALAGMFALRPIGGDIISPATAGKLYQSLIVSTIKEVYPDHAFRVTVSAPAGDTDLTIGQVAVLDDITATVTLEVDP
jgi:uncharacterized phage protein gp47/JayE